jgi:hypothetical protein
MLGMCFLGTTINYIDRAKKNGFQGPLGPWRVQGGALAFSAGSISFGRLVLQILHPFHPGQQLHRLRQPR